MSGLTSRFVVLLFVFLMVFSFSSVNITQAAVTNEHEWTTFQKDETRAGYTKSPAPDTNQTYWKFQTGGPITSSPIVSAGMVFVSSTDGYLYAVNATTGTKLWDFWVGADVNSPSVAHGKVFITSKSGNVYAINMYTGLEIWSQTLGEEAGFGAPLIVGTRAFVNGRQTVFVFNEAVGVNLYNEQMAHANGIAHLAYDSGLIFAVTKRRTDIGVDGFEAIEGTGRFWVTLASTEIETPRSGAAIGEEKMFVVGVNPNGTSTIFELSDFGIRTWERIIDGATEVSPAIAYNTVYVPTSNYAYALDIENGTVKWSRPMDGEYSVSSPAVADGKVYFGLDNNYVYSLDAFTGDLIWSYRTEGAVESSPAISDGLLFVGSNDGNLYAIGNHVIPEFPSWTPLLLLLSTLAVALSVYRRKLAKKRAIN